MKKTMFITSVIMVVVMAIALTTSSLAWFSATGSADVTTSKMSVQAKAQASAGIQIANKVENDPGAWLSNIDLKSGNSETAMEPAMLYTYTSSATPLMALVNNGFIYNEVDQNNNFTGTAKTGASVKTFASEFFITNVSEGASSGATVVGPKYIKPQIKFYNSDDTAYTFGSLDPVLYVAILADHDITTTNGDSNYTQGSSVNYELIKLFASSQVTTASGLSGQFFDTSLTSVNFGAAEEEFAATQSAASGTSSGGAYDSVSVTPANLTTALAPIYQNNAIGEVKAFKVIAWYDGATLKNSNSGGTIKFELKFTALDSNS